MPTYLLTWNPEKWHWSDLQERIAEVKRDGYCVELWSCGVTKRIRAGDRVFLTKLGAEPRGIIAAGHAVSDVDRDWHWNAGKADAGKTALYVEAMFDSLLDPQDNIFPYERLKEPMFSGMNWSPMASGTSIPDPVAATLEVEWANFVIQVGHQLEMPGRMTSDGNLSSIDRMDVPPHMPTLNLHDSYSRRAVHDIFSPDTVFQSQRGLWGLYGIIPLPSRAGDYVFFVTHGQSQGEHIFDVGITEDGVFSWQSQRLQTLNGRRTQEFIAHDELVNTIYLFLRTRAGVDYTYLGPLKYLKHDTDREMPVWFQWQVMEWPIPDDVLNRIGLPLVPTSRPVSSRSSQPDLVKVPAPASSRRSGVQTATFRGNKGADHAETDVRNRKLGLAGERLVFAHEQQVLVNADRSDLASKVRHISQIEGDGAGYDVLSYTPAGDTRHIEVKTTTGSASSSFFMTSNEVAFSTVHSQSYVLVRVYEYDAATKQGKYYEISGDVQKEFDLTAQQYRVRPR